MKTGKEWSYVATNQCMWLPEAGRAEEGPSPRLFGGSMSLITPYFSTSCLQNCDTIHFCCFEPPVGATDVMGAPGN